MVFLICEVDDFCDWLFTRLNMYGEDGLCNLFMYFLSNTYVPEKRDRKFK